MKVTSKLCMQKDLGVNGNLFGGFMLAWCDEAAAIYARYITGEKRMVTLKFSEFLFLKPVKEGDIVEFHCEAIHRGTSSVEISVEVVKDITVNVVKTNCVFVCVDDEGHKMNITNWREE